MASPSATGLALIGNCGYGALARAGGGDLRAAVVVLVRGISAYTILSRPFAALRIRIFPARPAVEPQGLPWLTDAPGAGGILIGATISALAAASPRLWNRPALPLWGVAVELAAGAVVAAGCTVGPGPLGPFALPSFSAPVTVSAIGRRRPWSATAHRGLRPATLRHRRRA